LRDFADFGGKNGYTNEERPAYCQQQNCSTLNVLFSDVYFTLIAGRFSAVGLYNHKTVGKIAIFNLYNYTR